MKSILEAIDISFDDRRITIKSDSDMFDIEGYYNSFQSLESWVKCCPNRINDFEYEITYKNT